jgi:hypothetical protein
MTKRIPLLIGIVFATACTSQDDPQWAAREALDAQKVEEVSRDYDEAPPDVDEAELYSNSLGGNTGNGAGLDHPQVPAIRDLLSKCTDDTVYNHDVNDCDDFANRLTSCIQRNGGDSGTIIVQCGKPAHQISYVCSTSESGERLCCAVEPQYNRPTPRTDPILACEVQPPGSTGVPSFGSGVLGRVCFGQPGTIISIKDGPQIDSSDGSSRTCSQTESTCSACHSCCIMEYNRNPVGTWLTQCKDWCKDQLGKTCPTYPWTAK